MLSILPVRYRSTAWLCAFILVVALFILGTARATIIKIETRTYNIERSESEVDVRYTTSYSTPYEVP